MGRGRPLLWPSYLLAGLTVLVAAFTLLPYAEIATIKVAVSAVAVGYALPKFSTSAVRARLKGMSISDAQRRLRHDFPGSSIEIRTRPLALPWLPFVGGNINLTVVVEPTI